MKGKIKDGKEKKNEIKSKLEKLEGKTFLRKINNTVSWRDWKEIRLGRSSRVKWNLSYMCRTIGERPVTLTTTVQILISVCSGSSLFHLPRSSLKYPIYTYLQWVYFFPFESIKSLFSGRMSSFCILGVEGRPTGDRMGSVFGQQSVTKQRLS